MLLLAVFFFSIQRYAVIPLSTNSGLIGWVPHSDTLHTLIREYRDKKKILLNIEHRIMLRMAPDYEHLNLMQKVEVFEHAIANTQGDDLAKVLWLKSPSSEVRVIVCKFLLKEKIAKATSINLRNAQNKLNFQKHLQVFGKFEIVSTFPFQY